MSRHRLLIPALTLAAALAVVAPGSASAASSGGWSPLGHGATATSNALTGKVETFTSVGNRLFVGGDFLNAGGIAAADGIGVWNGSSWAAVGARGRPVRAPHRRRNAVCGWA